MSFDFSLFGYLSWSPPQVSFLSRDAYDVPSCSNVLSFPWMLNGCGRMSIECFICGFDASFGALSGLLMRFFLALFGEAQENASSNCDACNCGWSSYLLFRRKVPLSTSKLSLGDSALRSS